MRDWARIFFDRPHSGNISVILKGYIDESYGPPERPKFFTLACTLSDMNEWPKIESAWKKCLAAKNKRLAAQGRKTLSRYHATDCANRRNEFKGWTVEEQIEFTKTLLAIFKRHWVNVIAYTMPMEAFYEEFPECADDPFPSCYSLIKILMVEIVDQIERARRKHRRIRKADIVLFYERNAYGGVLQSSFDVAMNDPTFTGKEFFKTIAAVGWEDCTAIQVADLMAYDSFKDAQQGWAGKPHRRTIEFLLNTRVFSGRSRTFKADAYKHLRKVIEEGRNRIVQNENDARGLEENNELKADPAHPPLPFKE
jgi:hypothetical protein